MNDAPAPTPMMAATRMRISPTSTTHILSGRPSTLSRPRRSCTTSVVRPYDDSDRKDAILQAKYSVQIIRLCAGAADSADLDPYHQGMRCCVTEAASQLRRCETFARLAEPRVIVDNTTRRRAVVRRGSQVERLSITLPSGDADTLRELARLTGRPISHIVEQFCKPELEVARQILSLHRARDPLLWDTVGRLMKEPHVEDPEESSEGH